MPTNWKVNPPGRFVCKQGLIKGLSTIGFQVVGGLKVVGGGFKYLNVQACLRKCSNLTNIFQMG